MPPVFKLGEDPTIFPDPELALTEPNGLLAIGGDLTPSRLLKAYSLGIFPWFEEGEPILWWSPDPRAVLFLQDLRISTSLKKTLRRGHFQVTCDEHFDQVIRFCALPRRQHGVLSADTWITESVINAYCHLFELGYAHSFEVHCQGVLVGGIYGVSIGQIFFGESMFSHQRDASKVAIYYLVKQLTLWGFTMMDCQMLTSHLASLGAKEIPRTEFLQQIAINNALPSKIGKWTLNSELLN